jgi:hypothetical protein
MLNVHARIAPLKIFIIFVLFFHKIILKNLNIRGKIIPFLLELAIVIIIFSCANPVAPTGGPKDVTPPKVIHCDPLNQSLQFTGNSIEITFDEFVNLDNATEKIILSPPLKTKPNYGLRGKNLLIKIEDTLHGNTTYTFFFGDAIKDVNENNSLNDFEYVFSTGSYLDSLILKGTVVNTFILEPEKDVWVMLYESFADSVPYKEIPFYVSRTDEKGSFAFSHLRNRHFKLFALKDANSNYLYDLPNEQIAFSDTPIEPWEQKPVILGDTSTPESSKSLEFHMFQETDSIQRLIDNKLLRDGLIRIVFRFPIKDLDIQPLNNDLTGERLIEELNPGKDTLLLWITPPLPDTLHFIVKDADAAADTLKLSLLQSQTGKKILKRESKEPKLVFTNNIGKQNMLDIFKPLILTSPYPIKTYDLSSAIFIDGIDTVKPKLIFNDNINRSIRLDYAWREDYKYELIVPDSIFTDIMGYQNDSIILRFLTSSFSEYGDLKVHLETGSNDTQYIIQLVDEKNTILISEIISGSSLIEFNHLLPGKYRLKAVFDANRNKQWDTGIYLKHKQPEKVIYYNKVIDIRANWVFEESWSL